MKSLEKSTPIPRSGIRELMMRAQLLPDAIHLEIGEPASPAPQHVKQAAKAAIDSDVARYTDNAGVLPLRTAIAEHINKKYITSYTPAEVVVASGAINVLHATLMALTEPGDEVLIPDPGWPNYEQILIGLGAKPVHYPLDPDNGFVPDYEKLQELATEKTVAIIQNNPGNPTGAVYSQQEVQKLYHFSSEHDLYFVSDEIYDDIVFNGSHSSALSIDTEGRVIGVFGFSKSYAMTGWRIGYAVAPAAITNYIAPMLELTISCTNAISQAAALAALQDSRSDNFIKENRIAYQKRAERAYELLLQGGVKAYPAAGAFYMLVDLSDTGYQGVELAIKLLEETGVATSPGITFGASAASMVRVSFSASDEQVEEGMRRICQFVHEHRKAIPHV